MIKSQLPEVEAPDLPEYTFYYAEFFKYLDYFNFHVLTECDFNRNKRYAVNRERKKLEESFTDTLCNLKSLDLKS